MASRINLGDLARDTITGFRGIVIGRTTWLIGCERLCLQPQKLDKDGKVREANWFDVPQVALVKRAAFKVPARRDVGGPRDEQGAARRDPSR